MPPCCQKHLVLLWQQNEDVCLAAYAVANVDGIQIAFSLKVVLGGKQDILILQKAEVE